MVNFNYTLVMTSCNRHDLLYKTLDSFVKFADILPTQTIIVEDSNSKEPEWLSEFHEELGDIKWLANGKNKGQIYSIDRAYSEVRTDYIFHCEDDWEFYRTSFIKESFEILEKYPNIIQCWIRDDGVHPSVMNEFPFPIMQPEWSGGWSGFSFNPGLRRLSDYQKIGSYGKHVGYDPRTVDELHLSKLYYELGFFAAKLPGACKHIGHERHVDFKVAPKPPKILIALPVCHKYTHGTNEHDLVRTTLRPVGVSEQVAAVKATWLKDLEPFKSYVTYKLFYGGNGGRTPESDEVFLDCGDSYVDLPQKTHAICKWAIQNNFDYIYKCDDDTFVHVDRLLSTDFEKYDYYGNVIDLGNKSYCGGGAGYWLSSNAMEIIAKQGKPMYPPTWAEDNWVGTVLSNHGIKAVHDGRYRTSGAAHWVDVDKLDPVYNFATFHACKPEDMVKLYNKVVGPSFKPILRDGQVEGQDELSMIMDTLKITELSGPDLNKETKNKVNKSLEKLVIRFLEQKRRLDIIEQRIENFNKKSSQKIL